MMMMMNEIDALQARKLIAEKEWIIANAMRDLSLGGWSCDYTAWMAATDAELEAILEKNKLRDTTEE